MSKIEELNTLLSIRLNLHEYDKIPWQFKDFTIQSGRVTFKVAGEFEIDLGIADEDPESQFWFIDFRFLFSPALSALPARIFKYVEDRVNIVLKDGLLGCYNLLHELVLTHKVSEFRRQASELSRGTWIESLKIQPLNRSVSIQYWTGKQGPKSWIILGVHSGIQEDGRPNPKATSRVSVRWFRDGKEVKDAGVPLDTVNISVVSLLKTIITMHVKFLLTSIYERTKINPIYAEHENLVLHISDTDAANSALKVQLTESDQVTIKIEPITGSYVLHPPTSQILQAEEYLNANHEPASTILGLRSTVILEDVVNLGSSAGWAVVNGLVISRDDINSKMSKNAGRLTYFRRASWAMNWFLALQIGRDGEQWFLLEVYVSSHKFWVEY